MDTESVLVEPSLARAKTSIWLRRFLPGGLVNDLNVIYSHKRDIFNNGQHICRSRYWRVGATTRLRDTHGCARIGQRLFPQRKNVHLDSRFTGQARRVDGEVRILRRCSSSTTDGHGRETIG